MKPKITPEAFRDELLAVEGFIDEKDVVHHEFKSGKHGRKIEFSVITKGTKQYERWRYLNKLAIQERYPNGEDLLIIGMADGMTQMAADTAASLGARAAVLKTEKLEDGTVRLTEGARLFLGSPLCGGSVEVVELEDTGTTGGTTGGVGLEIRRLTSKNPFVLHAWQRSSELPFLDENHIPYGAHIHEVIPSLSPELCRARGDCAQEVPLIPYGQD